jgi:nitrogen fixation-related uncharacterized protein
MQSILYTIIVIILLVAALLWAIKSGQFKQQQRARRLPLNGDPAKDAASHAKPEPRDGARFSVTPMLAAILSAVVLLWLTFLFISR